MVKRIILGCFGRRPCQGGTGGFDGGDHFSCGFADAFQRGFQLRQFLIAAPAGDIGKGIVRCVDPEVLTDHIGDTLGLNFSRWPVLIRFPDDLAVFYRQGVELGVGRLMDQRL